MRCPCLIISAYIEVTPCFFKSNSEISPYKATIYVFIFLMVFSHENCFMYQRVVSQHTCRSLFALIHWILWKTNALAGALIAVPRTVHSSCLHLQLLKKLRGGAGVIPNQSFAPLLDVILYKLLRYLNLSCVVDTMEWGGNNTNLVGCPVAWCYLWTILKKVFQILCDHVRWSYEPCPFQLRSFSAMALGRQSWWFDGKNLQAPESPVEKTCGANSVLFWAKRGAKCKFSTKTSFSHVFMKL